MFHRPSSFNLFEEKQSQQKIRAYFIKTDALGIERCINEKWFVLIWKKKTPPENLCGDKQYSIKKICLIYYFRLLVLLLIVCLFFFCFGAIATTVNGKCGVSCKAALTQGLSPTKNNLFTSWAVTYKDSKIIDIFVCFCQCWSVDNVFFSSHFVLSILHLWLWCAYTFVNV